MPIFCFMVPVLVAIIMKALIGICSFCSIVRKKRLIFRILPIQLWNSVLIWVSISACKPIRKRSGKRCVFCPTIRMSNMIKSYWYEFER